MSRKTEVLVVDGERYSVTSLKTTVGSDLYEELLRMVAPGLKNAEIAPGTDAEKLIFQVLMASIGDLPRGIINRLGKLFADHTKVLMKSGSAETAVELNEGMYEEHFSGRFGHLTRWIFACLRFNFSDFLPSAAKSGGQT